MLKIDRGWSKVGQEIPAAGPVRDEVSRTVNRVIARSAVTRSIIWKRIVAPRERRRPAVRVAGPGREFEEGRRKRVAVEREGRPPDRLRALRSDGCCEDEHEQQPEPSPASHRSSKVRHCESLK